MDFCLEANANVAALDLGAKNRANVSVREKFLYRDLKGCQKYFGHPLKQGYEIPHGKGKVGHFSPPQPPTAPLRARGTG